MKKCSLLIGIGILLIGAPLAAQGFDVMAMADTDQDGKVTIEEYAAFRESGWGFFAAGEESVKLADLPEMAKGSFKGITPNAQGMISHADYTAAAPRLFKEADKNGDGSLDSAEINAPN
ncbi:EF hand [Sphingobium sp. AP50]|uniref:hypothetical protein n=1 Tax=Sphingobium sp. AP50 TaxID=1884369 RepID=UPI0008C5ED74|nr:hypothetical protein [Sphingobium sp. AP50]SEK06254.1 EF hand [Sphingobium sp. AP50]